MSRVEQKWAGLLGLGIESCALCVRYLESCLMAIDDQDSLVRSHLAEVLGGLTEALKKVEANMATTQPAKVRWIEGEMSCLRVMQARHVRMFLPHVGSCSQEAPNANRED